MTINIIETDDFYEFKTDKAKFRIDEIRQDMSDTPATFYYEGDEQAYFLKDGTLVYSGEEEQELDSEASLRMVKLMTRIQFPDFSGRMED